jgi:hypothetical protein
MTEGITSAADTVDELISQVSCSSGVRDVFMFPKFQTCSQMPLKWHQRYDNQHIHEQYDYPKYEILDDPLCCQTQNAHGADIARPNVSREANSSDVITV